MKDNEKATRELARLCNLSYEKVKADMQRDFYLTAPEAVSYGVVDEVLAPSHLFKVMRHRGFDDQTINYGHFVGVQPVKPNADEPAPSYSKLDTVTLAFAWLSHSLRLLRAVDDEYVEQQIRRKRVRTISCIQSILS